MASSPSDGFQVAFWGAKRAVADAAEEAYGRHGVRAGQQFILKALWEEDSLTPGEIANRLHLATPTVTKAAMRMESAGLLTRRADPKDARLVRLHLTKRGRELRAVIDEEMRQLTDRALKSLAAAERKALIHALTAVRHNLTADDQSR